MSVDGAPAWVTAMGRHLVDLRDNHHGPDARSVTRAEKEAEFRASVGLLDAPVRGVLDEANRGLLLDTGTVTGGEATRTADGGLDATWSLSWPAQRAAGQPPISLTATYGAAFHHPHLRGRTVADWPLNVFTADEAAAETPTIRAIVAAEIHNLVFASSYRVIPSITAAAAPSTPAGAAR